MRLWLTSLLLIPVLAMAGAAFALVAVHLQEVSRDNEVATLVRQSVGLDAVRDGLVEELLPALAGAITRDAQLTDALGLTPTQAAPLMAVVRQLPVLRVTTDLALAAIDPQRSAAAVHGDWQTRIVRSRELIDAGTDLPTAFDSAVNVLSDISAAEHAAIVSAVGRGLDPATDRAFYDLRLVTRAVAAAGDELPLFIAAERPGLFSQVTTVHSHWLEAWGRYQTSAAVIRTDVSEPIRAAWVAATGSKECVAVDAALARSAGTTLQMNGSSLLDVVLLDPSRSARLATVQAQAVGVLMTAVADQQRASRNALATIVALVLLATAASLLAGHLTRRSLTRPLVRLARQARRISEGELSDVVISGPREVRVVARGLAAAVNGLRAITAQASAVAAGDLNNAVLAEAVPGLLGSVVHASVASVASAIRDSEHAQLALAHRAGHDLLTELPNRTRAMTQIDGALARARLTAATTALLFVDLDHFKSVNDALGLAAGDEVLRVVGARMSAIVGQHDMVARLGGDEFVILRESVTGNAGWIRLAERIVAACAEPIDVEGRDVRIGATVGVALCNDTHIDAGRLLNEAGAALYRAKRAGRGRFEVFDDALRTELDLQAEVERDLVTALADGGLVLYYQPVVDLASGEQEGMEALIRWNRPGHGLVSPDDFIPIAEKSSLINQIGCWVLQEATRQMAQWVKDTPSAPGLEVAVNISGRHVADPQLVAQVARALAQSGLAPQRLVIEVTETVLMDLPAATVNLRALRALGVRISIDDFGTGYTSIGQIPDLPADIMKIDRSFVISVDPAQRDLVKLMSAAAHAFGLRVLAEGIENKYQADAMRAAGAESAQGYYFAVPLTADEMSDRFRARRPAEYRTT